MIVEGGDVVQRRGVGRVQHAEAEEVGEKSLRVAEKSVVGHVWWEDNQYISDW